MKLNTMQAEMVEDQLGAMALEEDHPLNPELREVYGDHTFLLNGAGLNIVEPNNPPLQSTARVIKLGTWTTEACEELRIHEPRVLTLAVELGPSETDTIH